MSDAGKAETTERLSPRMTLDAALRCAMEFERTARDFYAELANRVEPDLQPLVLELADEERSHLELLAQLVRNPALESALSAMVTPPPSHERFASYVGFRELSDMGDADALLEYAEGRERIAFEHYGYLAEITPPGPLRDLFLYLREQESQHAARIQTRWSSLFSVF